MGAIWIGSLVHAEKTSRQQDTLAPGRLSEPIYFHALAIPATILSRKADWERRSAGPRDPFARLLSR